MLLTFAELQFLTSLASGEPEVELVHVLEEPAHDLDTAIAAGLASLVARGLCAEEIDSGQRVVAIDAGLVAILEAISSAAISLRVTTVAPDRTTFWLLLVGARRLAITPAWTGVYHVELVGSEMDLRHQTVSLVRSALADEPRAGVAIARSGRVDAMSFRTNDELGGPGATDDERMIAVAQLVDDVFADHHPSRG